jgi:hypothetical protein
MGSENSLETLIPCITDIMNFWNLGRIDSSKIPPQDQTKANIKQLW